MTQSVTNRNRLPPLALAVRQPWAWAIIHAGKDIENRGWRSPNPGLAFRGRVAIHVASGMTRDEFECAMEDIDMATGPEGARLQSAADLVRGAIIGSVTVVDIVRASASPWWCGPVGLVLADPVACDPIPCKGHLGFFTWRAGGALAEPAQWMLPPDARRKPSPREPRPLVARGADLFDNGE